MRSVGESSTPQALVNSSIKISRQLTDGTKLPADEAETLDLLNMDPQVIDSYGGKSKVIKMIENTVDKGKLERWNVTPKKPKALRSETMDSWCEILAGASDTRLVKLEKAGKIKLSTSKLSELRKMAQSKSNLRRASHTGTLPRCSIPGYKFYGDASVGHVKSLIDGYVNLFVYVDDATNQSFVYGTALKSDAKFTFQSLQATSPWIIRILSTDGAKEYFCAEMHEACLNAVPFRVLQMSSPPYTPERNARPESLWGRIFSLSRFQLSRCNGTRVFWYKSAYYSNTILTHMPYGPNGDKLPYEEFFHLKADFTKFYTFGCTCAVKILKKDLYGKSVEQSQWGIYLGWDPLVWKHEILGLDTGRIHYNPTFVPFINNFGAMHLFLRKNPGMSDKMPAVSPAGELIKQANAGKTNFLHDTIEGWNLWKQTSSKHVVNTTLPNISGIGSKKVDDENDEDDEPVVPPPVSTNDDFNGFPDLEIEGGLDTDLEPQTQENILTHDKNELLPEVMDELEEPTVANDVSFQASRNLENVQNVPLGSDRSNRYNRKDKIWTSTVAPSEASYEASQLATQNARLHIARESFGKTFGEKSADGTMAGDVSTTPVDNSDYTASAHFAYTVLSENEWDKDELFANKCEIAMHVFCLNCLEQEGYWTDVALPSDRVKQTRKRKDRNTEPVLMAMPTVDGPEPQSMAEARNWHVDSEKYVAAGNKELKGHHTKGTFVPCELPVGVKPIDTKLFFVRKSEPPSAEYPDGIRHKARLVARGFTQISGENFNWDTIFAPVLRTSSIRWMFSQAAQQGWEMTGSDVVQAFLQADLKTEEDDADLQDIYIQLPKGCEIVQDDGKVLRYGRLVKALYGLKQAPKRWNKTFHDFITAKLGFVQHKDDPCLYQLTVGTSILIMGVYVDDLVKVSNDTALRKRIDDALKKEFDITHTGAVREFLGMELEFRHTSDGRKYLNVSQGKYIDKILKRFKLDDCKIKSSPSVANEYLQPRKEDASTNDPDFVNLYRQMIGALIYLVTLTRIDIAYDVSAVAMMMSNPTAEHHTAVVRIFRYLRGTRDYSLKYFDIPQSLTLAGFVDSNYLGDHDSRSVTGFLFHSGAGLVSWLSKRQPTIATSTSHAETTALFHAVREAIMHRDGAEGFRFQNDVLLTPTPIYVDNAVATALATDDSTKHTRTKHWAMAWNWLHEQRNLKTFYATWIPGPENYADLLTKPLNADLHLKICKGLNLLPLDDHCGDPCGDGIGVYVHKRLKTDKYGQYTISGGG